MPDRLVINTGPLLAIIAGTNSLQVLASLYKKVVVPWEVCQEIQRGGGTSFGLREFDSAHWLEKRSTPTLLSPLLQQTVDPGEASVIQVAFKENIKTVAIDESVGRRIARACTNWIHWDLDSCQKGRPISLYTGGP